MRITGSDITMSSKSSLVEQYSKEETLKSWVGNNQSNSNIQNLLQINSQVLLAIHSRYPNKVKLLVCLAWIL